jgi:SAM-dependent methyltransferase
VGLVTDESELDKFAWSYYLNPPPDTWLEERVQAWLIPWLAGRCRGRVLEMGWGTGIVARSLAEYQHDLGLEISVVEGSPKLAEEARLVLPGRVHQSLFEVYDPGPVFDTVLCLHVLEHLDEPQEMLGRIRGWLKPEGRLIVVTPNASSLHRRVGEMMTGDPPETLSERDLLVGHRRVFTIRDLVWELGSAGFETSAGTFGWFLKPVNNARMLEWPEELIDALCDLGWHGRAEDAANIGVIARRS